MQQNYQKIEKSYQNDKFSIKHATICRKSCIFANLGGDVDVIVDVAVAGGKMSLGNAQEQVAFLGGQLDHVDHNRQHSFSAGRAHPPQNITARRQVALPLRFVRCLFFYCTGKWNCAQDTKSLKNDRHFATNCPTKGSKKPAPRVRAEM